MICSYAWGDDLPLPAGGERCLLEHDPEKWNPVFGKDHAQSKIQTLIRFNWIGV
jgi:hypothetical protein